MEFPRQIVATRLCRVPATAHRVAATALQKFAAKLGRDAALRRSEPEWLLRTAQRAVPTTLIALLIAILHAAMSFTATKEKSPTFDEPQHLTAGYSYWLKDDFRLDPENGNLPARFAALPLMLSKPNFVPLNDRGWQRADEGRTGHQFFYEAGNDSDGVLRQGRMMMSIFGAALCFLIYRCAREFFGVIGGLMAEIVTAFDPTMLAHSALVASDIAAAFFFTAVIWSAWRLLEKITPWTLAIASFSLSGLFLTKFSGPIVLPIIGILSILRIFSRAGIALQIGGFRNVFEKKWDKACAIAASGIVLGTLVFCAIWLSFSFRYSAWTDNPSSHEGTAWHWNHLLEDHGVVETAVAFARTHHLLPEAYLYGFAYVQKHAGDRPAFLDNQWSMVGFRSFFPRAFFYKTPLPLLCLMALGLGAALARWNERRRHSLRAAWEMIRRDLFRLSPLWTLALIYGVCAISSSLNIGHRHILPMYPVLFIACGGAAYLLSKNYRIIGTAVVAILLLWQIGESVAIRPHYLAYFNEIAGGPARGYKHLVDSSLDWGQDLPALKVWLDQHKPIVEGKPLYLAYFGTGDPRWYGIEAKWLPENPYSGEKTFAPLMAGTYCVSATTLQSVYASEIGPWSTAYEQHYKRMLAEIQRYHQTASNPSARAQLIANEGALPWIKKIKEFERIRFERLCAYLRQREPVARIGYSIFVFDVGPEEVDQALHGPPAELTEEISVTGF
jgi:Dolichyl-phosphate-mannose-protein mannosyltransferase